MQRALMHFVCKIMLLHYALVATTTHEAKRFNKNGAFQNYTQMNNDDLE